VKVAVVSPYDFAFPGGVQDQVAGLVAWLREAGHEAWPIAPGSGGPEGVRHVGRSLTVPANRSRAPIGLSPSAVRRLAAALGGADVVHVHEPFMPLVSTAAVRAATVPVVGTFHADPSRLVRRFYRWAQPALRRHARRLSAATAVSEVARSAVAGLVDARIVPNGVDTAALRVDGVERVEGRVVFLGRDEPRKGLDVLLQAWPLVRARTPAATLHVLGAHRASGPAGVRFLGRVSAAVKSAELSSAAALCAPNLGGESFGMILIEGMAAGCAVVASDLEAFRAVAGRSARFVPPGNPTELGASLGDLLADPTGRAELAAAGRTEVARFDKREVVEAYLAAYRDAADGAGAAR
jgi:phosphatidylinositol alpha-mannosyltransferase